MTDQEIIDHIEQEKEYHPVQVLCEVLKVPRSIYYQSFHVSLKRVQRIMKAAGIRSIITKKCRPASSASQIEERDNLLEQDFKTTTINEEWVADITYIHTLKNGWCYLASVLDLHTKKIVGYSFSKSMTIELVLQASTNTIEVQQPEDCLILHNDLGS